MRETFGTILSCDAVHFTREGREPKKRRERERKSDKVQCHKLQCYGSDLAKFCASKREMSEREREREASNSLSYNTTMVLQFATPQLKCKKKFASSLRVEKE